MSNARPISEYSRQELYDLIWSTRGVKLAADFGISKVAVTNHCVRLKVPRPRLGYWAKVAAGQKPRKTPLPPTADEIFKQAAQRRLQKALPLPTDTEPLLPLASELMKAIAGAELDRYKRAQLEEQTLPRVTVSRNLSERVAKAFHVLLQQMEALGISFHKYQGSYESGYFKRYGDRLYMTIAEDIERPDGSRFSAPTWQEPQVHEKPSGYLTFTVKPHTYSYEGTKQWSETTRLPLEQTLAQVVADIRKHYLEIQERRELEKIESAKRHVERLQRRREWEQQETIRLQKERERKHAEALAAAVQARKNALLRAAENWRLSHILLEFICACEARWKGRCTELTAEQTAWLTWAREISEVASPISAGYPDPATDGAFDPASIPVGGPYPQTRDFSRPSP
jgi:hypothetical protein